MSLTKTTSLENNLKISLILSIWANLIFTILKESNPTLKSGIKLIDNHWVGHTIYAVIFFLTIIGILQLMRININLKHHFSKWLYISFAFSLITFLLFYLIHSHAFD